MEANVDLATETQEELDAIYRSLAILQTNADHFFVIVMSIVVFCEYASNLFLLSSLFVADAEE